MVYVWISDGSYKYYTFHRILCCVMYNILDVTREGETSAGCILAEQMCNELQAADSLDYKLIGY